MRTMRLRFARLDISLAHLSPTERIAWLTVEQVQPLRPHPAPARVAKRTFVPLAKWIERQAQRVANVANAAKGESA